ncbi:MAG: hypothetical protein ABF856_16885 [Acetobacter aceti]|uniref:Uncharacterized protein n=1 Tax=Acetobacter aceti TaxID=435 RepID=A0A1U9KFU4_ACEAC|nr:hypothetical protein [Acetobacter aceti]AQS84597.1 hypothetical protein A0U92_07185 [Acetobacter aceti]
MEDAIFLVSNLFTSVIRFKSGRFRILSTLSLITSESADIARDGTVSSTCWAKARHHIKQARVIPPAIRKDRPDLTVMTKLFFSKKIILYKELPETDLNFTI